jgi:hypothetical protein
MLLYAAYNYSLYIENSDPGDPKGEKARKFGALMRVAILNGGAPLGDPADYKCS